jgi:RHS repeat-associated protein
VAQQTSGIHGDYGQFYGFRCYEYGYVVGFSDGVILNWSCDGKNWGTVLQPQSTLVANCVQLSKNPGPPCCGIGNPVHPGYGNKYQEEVDYVGSAVSPLRFARIYNSKGGVQPTSLGLRWRTSFDRSLSQIIGSTVAGIYASRADGKILYFTLMKNGATVPLAPYDSAAVWTPDNDVADKLVRLVDGSGNTLGWTYYVAATEETETYDITGQLTALRTRSGLTQVLSYNAQGLLGTVTDTFGRQFGFTYGSAGGLASMADPAGGLYQYSYDAVGNLNSVTYPDLAVRAYSYNESAYTQNTYLPYALTGITDELGNRFATFNYNTQGDAISTEHAGGVEKYLVSYNFPNSTSVVTDPLGTARTYSFATLLGVVHSTGISQPCASCGNSSAITYDANSNVSSRTDFNNKTVCSVYDLTRNLETSRLEGALSTETCSTVLTTPPNRPDVRKVTTTWNATYRLPATITEPAPGGTKTTTFTYDASGNLTQKSITAPKNDGTSNTITRTWNWTNITLGRVLTATDPNGKVTAYAYYSDSDTDLGKRGNAQTITNAAGHVTQITSYDANGRPLTVTDPNGLVTTLAYDGRGRLTSRQVGVEQTGYVYDGAGQLTKVTQPDGSYVQYTFDTAHRLTQLNDGLGNKIVYTLDAMGNRVAESAYDTANNLARTRSRVFNALNQPYQDLGALSQATSYTYDNNYNLLTTTDPLNNSTGNIYDALNRLTQVLDPNSGVTAYAYDGANNLTQVIDPRSVTTNYTYDGLNDLVTQVSLDTGTATIAYDAAGNVLTKTDARGAAATYTYDALSRVSQITYSKSGNPNETQTFTYDVGANAEGRLTQVTDPAAITSWTYNSQGRVASKAQQMGGVIQSVAYGYNAAGQLNRVTTPSGQQVGYGYTNNRVSSITVNGQSLLTGANTKPFGPLSAWHWGNGLFTFRDYDTDGRLADWEFRDGTSILRKNQSFDAASRITAIADPNAPAASQAYQYDVLDRLSMAQSGSPVTHTQQFTYDAVGNRLNITTDGASINSLNSLNSNQLQLIVGAVPSNYYSGATALVFTYNNANRLVTIQSSGSPLASYAVNALGQRVSKTAAGTTTAFVYDEQGHLLGEYDGSGNLIEETVWLEDLPVATLRPTSSGNPTPINIYYVHADHLGSPRGITRPADNALMWQWDNLDPFGANAANENPSGQGTFKYGFRFPGQYYDAETGTHYNYFRDYDPFIGRYAESDPAGLRAGPNAFAYVNGRPISLFDPYGLASSGTWIDPPAFNFQNGWVDWGSIAFTAPTWSWWGKIGVVQANVNAMGYINIDVKCHSDCPSRDWEIHKRIEVAAGGPIQVGPNLWALLIGAWVRAPFAGIGAGIVLGGGSLVQGELSMLQQAEAKAGGLIATILRDGPNALCLMPGN